MKVKKHDITEKQKINQALIQIAKYHTNDRVRRGAVDRFLKENIPFIKAVIGPYLIDKSVKDEKNDLMQMALMSIRRPLELYEFESGNLFTSYWVWYIRSSINYFIHYEKGLLPQRRKTKYYWSSFSGVDEQRDTGSRGRSGYDDWESQFMNYVGKLHKSDINLSAGETSVYSHFEGGNWRSRLEGYLSPQKRGNGENAVVWARGAREKRIMRMVFLEGMTLDEIGRLEGVSRERIRQIKDDGLPALQNYVKNQMELNRIYLT